VNLNGNGLVDRGGLGVLIQEECEKDKTKDLNPRSEKLTMF